ncbi:MAG: sigma-70 family RNA polymerase sigma factor [Candidatus Hydrogenedentes bacterium]|nr:sigma-70 family RNA polymerase sigma factor [Candidatus Hydrogenedentota bacterium]
MHTDSSLSDAEAVAQTLSGKPDAFEVLVGRYLPATKAFLLSRTGNAEDAADVAQETFLKAYRALSTLREKEKFGPWLIRIAKNTAQRLIATRVRERKAIEGLPRRDNASNHAAVEEDARAMLLQNVAALPEPLREVLLLHYFAGKSTREIADLLGTSKWGAEKRLQRARRALGVRIVDHLGDSVTPYRVRREDVLGVMGAIRLLPPVHMPPLAAPDASLAHGIWSAAPPWAVASVGIVSLLAITFWIEQIQKAPEESTELTRVVLDRSAETDSGAAVSVTVSQQTPDLISSSQEMPSTTTNVQSAGVSAPTVRGLVVDSENRPIPGATLWAYSSSSNPQGGVSDAEGRFAIPAPDAITCTIRAACDAFVRETVHDVAVPSNNLRIVLQRLPVVSGRAVRADTGAPVTDFKIQQILGGQEPGRICEVHDSEGRFRLGLEPHVLFLKLAAPGFRVAVVNFPNLADTTSADIVAKFVAAPTIEGRVTDSAGQPISGAEVYLSNDGEHAERAVDFTGAVVTGTDGAYHIENVYYPEWTSFSIAEVFPKYVAAVFPGFAPGFAPLPGSRGQTRVQADIKLTRGGVLQGHVRVKGRSQRVRIYAMGVEPGQNCAVANDVDGAYQITGLPAGEWETVAEISGSSEDGHWEAQYRRTVVLAEGTTTTLDFDLAQSRASIEGNLFLDGQPMSSGFPQTQQGVDLDLLIDSPASRFHQSSRSSGAYQFTDLPAGRAHICVSSALPNCRGNITRTLDVDLSSGAHLRRDFDFTSGCTLRGRVQGAWADDTWRVSVLAGAAPGEDAPEWSLPIVASADVASGGATFAIPWLEAGEYTIVTSAHIRPAAGAVLGMIPSSLSWEEGADRRTSRPQVLDIPQERWRSSMNGSNERTVFTRVSLDGRTDSEVMITLP